MLYTPQLQLTTGVVLIVAHQCVQRAWCGATVCICCDPKPVWPDGKQGPYFCNLASEVHVELFVTGMCAPLHD